MPSLFKTPKAPAPPPVKDIAPIPQPTDEQSRMASRKAIAQRLAASGKASTALSKTQEGL